ncbi:hypothetical protein H0H93_002291 [Arthromyces matolae]|nr:hypothetical protein H0H93_002291 [Arthromyces matolae]
MDPSSVDFRAFYPYTPNEVKHRKRTTTAQLRTLEAVFKRDTKPNGPLRVELAAQLGMTARGVQVWFQNRRAKEKLKASKAAKNGVVDVEDKVKGPLEDDDDDNDDNDGDGDDDSFPAIKSAPAVLETQIQPPPTQPSTVSQPKIHIVTQPIPSAQETAVESRAHYPGTLYAYRRGSLPVNAFPSTEHSLDSPSLDKFDPLARRRSVDASLQRLATNPYAPLARAKNGAIFGPRAVASIRRPLCRTPLNPTPRITSMPYRLDMRRASMGNFQVSPQSTASPSPSPLSAYHGVRASLPEQNLYAVSSRTVSPPIPGPLPSPNFSFGAASTPSMVSASSGDSERYSPDPLHPFTYREFDQDEDEGTPASYYSSSRFGSITSIATSDSSFGSAYYPDHIACYDENIIESRRGSCASGHFNSLMSGLDVNCSQDAVSPHEHPVYSVHEEDSSATEILVADKDTHIETTYPSPSSTISPGGSPHPQGTPSIAISRTSELDHALSQASQVPPLTIESSFTPVGPMTTVEIRPQANSVSPNQYFYSQDTSQLQPLSSTQPIVEVPKYHYTYDTPFLTEGYPVLELQHQSFEAPVETYETMIPFDSTGQHVEQPYLYA